MSFLTSLVLVLWCWSQRGTWVKAWVNAGQDALVCSAFPFAILFATGCIHRTLWTWCRLCCTKTSTIVQTVRRCLVLLYVGRCHQKCVKGAATSVHRQDGTKATGRGDCRGPSFWFSNNFHTRTQCVAQVSPLTSCPFSGREAHWGSQELQRAEQVQESMS